MTDNIFTAVLTFGLLVAGTAAVGTEMFNVRQGTVAAVQQVVMLPAVTITGHRTPTEVVMLPAVTITGHRTVQVAYEPRAEQQR